MNSIENRNWTHDDSDKSREKSKKIYRCSVINKDAKYFLFHSNVNYIIFEKKQQQPSIFSLYEIHSQFPKETN